MHSVLTFRRLPAFIAILLFTGTAHSALLQVEPNVYRDTATNLEWLRVTETDTQALGLTDSGDPASTATASEIMAAIAISDYVLNQGFRVAATTEVSGLYNGSGGVVDFVDNICCGLPDTLNPSVEIFKLGSTETTEEQTIFPQNGGGQEQRALHFGDDGVTLEFSAVSLDGTKSLGDFFVMESAYEIGSIAPPGHEYSSYEWEFNFANDEIGVYLVRTVVPLPAAVYLFGSGLLILLRFRRKS
jgi:hypothetical protein